MNAKLSIGLVARRTGATVATIRYYEEIGLLPSAARTDSGQRHYNEATVLRLVFIRRCRDFGFSIDQVRQLVTLTDMPQRPCADVRELAAAHLNEVRAKLAEIKGLEATLTAIVGGCDAMCAGGTVEGCSIFEDLTISSGVSSSVPEKGCCG